MKLTDTINGMTSNDYQERFRAEYWQLKIRMDRLHRRASKIVAIDLVNDEDHDQELTLIDKQMEAMENYLKILEIRAAVENIGLIERKVEEA